MRPSLWVLLALAGCAAPGILGGPTKETTEVDCHDGTTCPLGYECSVPLSNGGHCEAAGGIVEEWGAHASARDASGPVIEFRACLGEPIGSPSDAGIWRYSTVPCDGGAFRETR